jgi:hypothetical protein
MSNQHPNAVSVMTANSHPVDSAAIALGAAELDWSVVFDADDAGRAAAQNEETAK